MCITVEVIMTIAGAVVLFLGKLYLSSELRLSGWRARLAGFLLFFPLPLIFGLGFLINFLLTAGIEIDRSVSAYLSILEYALVFSMPLVVGLMAFFANPNRKIPSAGIVRVSGQARLAEGKRWLDLGYDSRAIAVLEEVVHANPQSPEAHTMLAEAYHHSGDWAGEVHELQAALELDPRSAPTHYRISQAYARLGQNEQAERELKITLQLDPAHAIAAREFKSPTVPGR